MTLPLSTVQADFDRIALLAILPDLEKGLIQKIGGCIRPQFTVK
jgi:hypothetical protein